MLPHYIAFVLEQNNWDDEETMYQKALIFMKLGQYQKALAYALTLKNQDERTLEFFRVQQYSR